MTTEHDILREYLTNRGLKKTKQRHNILDVFLETGGHISAYELHELLQKKHRGIGFSTVYRTLGILTECGIANEVNFGDGQARFERAFRRDTHGHIVCTKCGKTEEFDTSSLAKFKNHMATKAGYTVSGCRFEIYGLCQKCRK